MSDHHIVKIGIDGGGEFLKVCLSILAASQNSKTEKRKTLSYTDSLREESYKDGGVEKLIFLAIIEDVKESHETIKMIIDLIEMNSHPYFRAFGMRLANLYFGIEGAISTHHCQWCLSDKQELQDLHYENTLRNVIFNIM